MLKLNYLNEHRRKLLFSIVLLVVVAAVLVSLSLKSESQGMKPISGWERLNTGLIDTEIKNIILTSQPSTIYLQTKQALFKSTDNGSSWVEIKTLPGDKKDVFVTSYESTVTGDRSDVLWLGTSSSLGKDEEGQRIRVSPLFTSYDGARTWEEITISCLPKYNTRNYMLVEGLFFDEGGNIYVQYLQPIGRLDDKKPFIMMLTRNDNPEYDYKCKNIGENIFNYIDDGMRTVYPNNKIGSSIVRPGFFGFFSDWNNTYAISQKNIYESKNSFDDWQKIKKPMEDFIFEYATSSTWDLIVAGHDKDRKSTDGKIGDKVFLRKSKSNSWENITGNLPEIFIRSVKSYNVRKHNLLYKRIFIVGESFYNVNNKTENKRVSGEIYIVTTDINIDNIPKNIKWNDITGQLNATLHVRDITDVEIQNRIILIGTKEQGVILAQVSQIGVI